MNMTEWVESTIASDTKKGLPVLSFPAVQKMNITVPELVNSADNMAEAMRIVAESVDSAAAVSFMDLSVEAEAFGSEVVIKDDELPTVVGAIIDEDTDPDSIFVPKVGDGRTGTCVESIGKAAELINDRPVLAGAIGPYSLAGRLMDVNEIMILSFEEPELVHAVLDKAADFITEYVKAFKEAGADGVVLAEPLAGLLQPEAIAEFSTPYVRRIVDAVQDDDFIVVYHNCGNTVTKAADTIKDTGAKAFHFGNAIKMEDIVGQMPADVLVMGNVDPTGVMRNGTPETVRETTLAVLKANADHPNFVISTGCDVPPMSPWENIDAFFGAIDEFYAK